MAVTVGLTAQASAPSKVDTKAPFVQLPLHASLIARCLLRQQTSGVTESIVKFITLFLPFIQYFTYFGTYLQKW